MIMETKTVTLTFYRSQILYDCGNLAYVEGDVMKTEDEHDRHQVMDIVEDGNVDRVTRVLDLTFEQCVELCYPYAKEPVESETALDDVFEETEKYVLRLTVPAGFSVTTANLLTKLIHELLVYRVMADWMSITKPDAEAKWVAKAEDMEGNITGTLNMRVGRVRRKLQPFG